MTVMRRFILGAVIATFAVAGLKASPVLAEPQRYVVDEDHVSVAFQIGHARFANLVGLFTDVSGGFVYDAEANELHSGAAVISSGSVFTGHDRRDGHVRDGDFLDVRNHPEIQFEVTDYEATGSDQGVVHGEITILGVTQPIRLDATINRIDPHPIGGAQTLGASMSGSLMRSDFGMDYALEDELVGDEVELIIEFEALLDEG